MNSINGNNNENGQEKPAPQQPASGPEAPRPERPEEKPAPQQSAGGPGTSRPETPEKKPAPQRPTGGPEASRPARPEKPEAAPEKKISTPAPVAGGAGAKGVSDRSSLKDSSLLSSLKRLFPHTWQKITAIGIAVAILIGALVLYLVQVHERTVAQDITNTTTAQQAAAGKVSIKVFYPSPTGLVPEERLVEPSEIQTRMVESAVREYLKGPSDGAVSYIPEGTRLLGLYRGSDGIIYMDFSHEFRSNFQGDAYGEFLLLRGLYESVMSNAKDVSGLKVLIDGKEVDTIGGHISLEGTLGSVVSSTMLEGYEGK